MQSAWDTMISLYITDFLLVSDNAGFCSLIYILKDKIYIFTNVSQMSYGATILFYIVLKMLKIIYQDFI